MAGIHAKTKVTLTHVLLRKFMGDSKSEMHQKMYDPNLENGTPSL